MTKRHYKLKIHSDSPRGRSFGRPPPSGRPPASRPRLDLLRPVRGDEISSPGAPESRRPARPFVRRRLRHTRASTMEAGRQQSGNSSGSLITLEHSVAVAVFVVVGAVVVLALLKRPPREQIDSLARRLLSAPLQTFVLICSRRAVGPKNERVSSEPPAERMPSSRIDDG
jgi:hypothetical protein